MIKITKKDLITAAEKQIINPEQAEALWNELNTKHLSESHFTGINVAYYLGGLLIMAAMTFFLGDAWDMLGGWGIAFVSFLYAAAFFAAGHKLYHSPLGRVPGGLLVTVSVCVVPLCIFGIETATGLWIDKTPGHYQSFYEWIKSSWLFMELCTILAGCVAIRFVRFPFLTAPIAFCLWFISMDLVPLLYGDTYFNYEQRAYVSMWFGLIMILASYLIDNRTQEDFAFWGYFFGTIAFWCGLSSLGSNTEAGRALYALINGFMIIVSVLLQRRVFIVFGGIGLFSYLGHLAYKIFASYISFSFALTLIGLGIIYLTVQYNKHQKQIDAYLMSQIPDFIRKSLPRNR